MGFDHYFFVEPSFARGMGRVLDLGASLQRSSYLISDTPDEADRRAVAGDWTAVGVDIKAAMEANDTQGPREK